jgi:signal transduction histidine kinase
MVLAENNANRLAALVNDLLDMEKMAAGKMTFDIKTCAVHPLLVQATDAIRHYQSERGVSVVMTGISEGINLEIDSQRFLQVMSNLLSNAVKYSPDNASVELTVSLPSSQIVRIAVIDQGPGIPVNFQRKIFEKFTQADSTATRKKGGTGLGLAITREFVLRMGGKIDFILQPGQGTCFYVEFPLSLQSLLT